ncbi:TPA: efflux transporter outer membrane subunit [Pseudomonas aeruginosa]
MKHSKFIGVGYVKLVSTSMLSVVLAACTTVGPDYHRPQLPDHLSERPQTNFDAFDARLVSADPVPSTWWRLYTDPVLDQLVQEALTHNTDLRVAVANLETAEANLRGVNAQAGVQTRIYTPEDGPAISLAQASNDGVSPSPGAHGQYNIAFGVSYELDVVGRIKRTLEMASATAQARAAAYDLARVTIAARVVHTYSVICALSQRRAVAQDSIALQEQSLALLERGAQAGIHSPLDVSRARALLAQLRAVPASLESQRQPALYELAVLLGRRPEDIPAPARNCTRAPTLERPLPVGDGVALIQRRPDVRMAERELAAATAKIGIETAALYPSVSFGAGIGTLARMGTDVLGDSAIHYSLGPVISWTLPNRTLARARIEAASAQARAALARFDAQVLSALQEVESALATYARHLDEYRQLEHARDDSKRSVAIIQRLGVGGAASTLERLDAERTLATSEDALAAAQARLAEDRVRIFLTLGGGW